MRSNQGVSAAIASVLCIAAAGCTSFSTVRSAEVHHGPSTTFQASVSTPPGPETGWFWSFECAEQCDHPVAGVDLGFTYGMPTGLAPRPVALGLGINGTHPYVDAYVQLGKGARPYGVGARVGVPVTNWLEHQLYGRYDVRVGPTTRLLLNPALFVHHGRSPNGENPGSFVAFVQGVGLLLERERVSFTPGVALVAGRAERTSYGRRFGPEMSVFGAASIGVTIHRPRAVVR